MWRSIVLRPELACLSNRRQPYSCVYLEELEQEGPRTGTRSIISRATNEQQATMSPPVVRHDKEAPPVEQLPTPVKTHLSEFFLFPGIETELNDMKKTCECAISLAGPLEFSLQENEIALTESQRINSRYGTEQQHL